MMRNAKLYQVKKPKFNESDVKNLIRSVDLHNPFLGVTIDGELARGSGEKNSVN